MSGTFLKSERTTICGEIIHVMASIMYLNDAGNGTVLGRGAV